MAIKIISAYDYRQLGKKTKRFTPWFGRRARPARLGMYKLRLVTGRVMRATWDGKSWRDNTNTRIRLADVQGWRGLTKSGYDATRLIQRDDAVSAFPEHRVPSDTVFNRLVRELGPVIS